MNSIHEGDLTRLISRLKVLRGQNKVMLEALKAAQPLLLDALAFVDCKKQLAQVEAAIKTAEGQ